uniref:DDE_Tnp_1_7 domain-containing protein n=1 Tax=Glossina austeni TaxID=7395 RepID=A0A1A9VC50_GLOAU
MGQNMGFNEEVPDAQGYHMYTDKYYTSISLAEDLLKMKCNLTGPVKVNRKGLSMTIRKSKNFHQKSQWGIVLSVLGEKHQAEGGKEHFIAKHIKVFRENGCKKERESKEAESKEQASVLLILSSEPEDAGDSSSTPPSLKGAQQCTTMRFNAFALRCKYMSVTFRLTIEAGKKLKMSNRQPACLVGHFKALNKKSIFRSWKIISELTLTRAYIVFDM